MTDQNTKTNQKDQKTKQKSKPYKTTFGETYVEPIGMGEVKKD